MDPDAADLNPATSSMLPPSQQLQKRNHEEADANPLPSESNKILDRTANSAPDSSQIMITEDSKKFSSPDSSSEDETQKKLLDFIKRRQTDLNNVAIPVSDSSTEEEDPTEEYQAHQIDLQDIETLRQRTLRDVAIHDKVGGDYIPTINLRPSLISSLEKKKEKAISIAQELRAPFGNLNDFDSFIDELTITDDQSWKTVELIKYD